jgi:tRNA (Thr-GGU) A37 N-methylase
VKVEKHLLHVEDIDVVDRTPLPDIKPCLPEFDVGEADRIGWIEAARSKAEKTSADTRFTRD